MREQHKGRIPTRKGNGWSECQRRERGGGLAMKGREQKSLEISGISSREIEMKGGRVGEG